MYGPLRPTPLDPQAVELGLEKDLRVPEATPTHADLSILTPNHRQDTAELLCFLRRDIEFTLAGDVI
jgi:hypothetical protein